MYKTIIAVFCWAAAMGLCSCSDGGKPADQDKDKDKKLVIAVIPKSTSGEFWVTVQRGAEDAAAANDVSMKWQGTLAETEKTEQIRIFENMVNTRVPWRRWTR